MYSPPSNLAEVAILVSTDHPNGTAILAGCPNQQRSTYIDSENRQRSCGPCAGHRVSASWVRLRRWQYCQALASPCARPSVKALHARTSYRRTVSTDRRDRPLSQGPVDALRSSAALAPCASASGPCESEEQGRCSSPDSRRVTAPPSWRAGRSALSCGLRRDLRINSGSQSSDDDDSINEQEPPIVATNSNSTLPGDIRRLHRNLETRIQPFWSSVLSSRTVRLQLFSSSLKEQDDIRPRHNAEEERDTLEHGPVTSRDIPTGVDGSFQARIRVTWEEMCNHLHELLINATLLAPLSSSLFAAPSETKALHLTLTNCPVRIISDIDDTIKMADQVSHSPPGSIKLRRCRAVIGQPIVYHI
ncbi:hypothetical protein B0H15DRAFT_798449 [Mycena belliarum]|uniref:Uncharacterized protein n=1 Tax=Mycena belliarum TaxID=1033014 RepID=A0AAD6XTQ9_9AGAR|nr:hypothetical protein B0H15DRAFT_798449 [Mycena belliae]